MRLFKIFIHLLLIVTIPAVYATPSVQFAHTPRKQPFVLPTTYDGIVNLIRSIEDEKAMEQYSYEELTQINEFICSLADEASVPSHEYCAYQTDKHELLYSADSYDCFDHDDIYQCGKRSKKSKKKLELHIFRKDWCLVTSHV